MDEQDTLPRVIKHRRRYTADFKAKVLAECEAPGASVAGVAISHGINPNLVQKWRRLAKPSANKDSFVALPMPMTAVSTTATVQFTVQIGAGSVDVDWPLDAIERSIPWLRALLQ